MTNRRTRVNPTLTRKHEAVKGVQKNQNPRSPLIFAGIGVGVLLVVILVLVIASPFRMAGADRIDEKNPSTSHSDGLTVSYISGEGMRLKLSTIPREVFLSGDSIKGYEDALEAIPAYLEMKSPLYLIESKGDAEVVADIVIPNASEPFETLDLYSWNVEKGRWEFVPATVDVANGKITTRSLVSNIAVFQTGPIVPMVSAFMEAGDTFDPAASGVLNLVIPSGVIVDGNGGFSGSLVGGWQLGAGYAVTPVITAEEGDALAANLSEQNFLDDHVNAITSFTSSSNYNGVVIDYRGVSEENSGAFVTFLSALEARLNEDGEMLIVLLPTPIQTAEGWSTGAYRWAEIGNAADIVIVRGKDQPADYGLNGAAYQMFDWASDQISRAKLQVFVPSSSYDTSANSNVSYFEAIDLLGMAGLAEQVTSIREGDQVSFILDGDVEVTPDQNSGAYILSTAEGGRQVWLVTASTVRARLDMIAQKKIGGISMLDFFDVGRDPALYTAVTEFKTATASSLPGQVSIDWTITGIDGATIAQENVGLATPFVWLASGSGTFNVNSQIGQGEGIDRGGVTIVVEPKNVPTPTATQVAAVVTQQPVTTQNSPAPVTSGGADGGAFALGGQVQRGYSPPAAVMQSAGMTWVKYQLKWSPGTSPSVACDLINLAHGAGFKVLLSIPGQLYPTSIDFAGYTEFLRGVAAYQPDAIEIWNEMNLYVEWPEGQINPASYVSNMLAPGYNAIKSVSPNTMVITGALAPTGVNNSKAMSDDQYVAGMAAAGAANYANCIGVHHNAGATSPSARTGHPAGTHYSWYFLPTLDVYYYGLGGALPVCVTEFGYVTGDGLGSLPESFSWGATNTLQNQADWLGEGASIARNLGWVRLMVIWNVGFTTWGSDPQAGYSITRPDGSCPACATLRAAVG